MNYKRIKRHKMNWKIITEDNQVSLHDHTISDVYWGNDIILLFDDGFDVTKENVRNKTGRHKQTGVASVILHNAIYMSGIKFLSNDAEKNVNKEEVADIDLEVLEFSFDSNNGKVEILGDAWDECLFCKLEFKASKVSYCWNEFVDDAWFQDWAKSSCD